MGLALGPNGLLAVAGSKEQSYLASFGTDLKQTGWQELPSVADPHGLMFRDDRIWVVSSGSNEVVRFDLEGQFPTNATSVYRHDDAEPQHFNGIARHGARILVSAFGVAASISREVSNTGYLLDIEHGEMVRQGLDQPHSPVTVGVELLFCESKRSVIWYDDARALQLDGYLRGLTVAPDGLIHVAACRPRPPREQLSAERGDAEILSVTRNGVLRSCRALSGVGAEVYDLLSLPDCWEKGLGSS
jgi:hypothetical protein